VVIREKGMNKTLKNRIIKPVVNFLKMGEKMMCYNTILMEHLINIFQYKLSLLSERENERKNKVIILLAS